MDREDPPLFKCLAFQGISASGAQTNNLKLVEEQRKNILKLTFFFFFLWKSLRFLYVLNVWIFFLILSVILILKMEGKKQRFWHVILCYFKKGKMQLKLKEICAVYREGAMNDQTCQKSGF